MAAFFIFLNIKMKHLTLFLMCTLIVFFVAAEEIPQTPEYYEQHSNIKNGETDTYYIRKYGVPEHNYIKPRYKFVGIYYNGIEDTYRSTNPDFREVPIKELFWNFNDDLNLTCWFHFKDGQWRVIAYVFWPPGAVF